MLFKRLVTWELGLKAHAASKETGTEKAFAKRAPGSLPDKRFCMQLDRQMDSAARILQESYSMSVTKKILGHQ